MTSSVLEVGVQVLSHLDQSLGAEGLLGGCVRGPLRGLGLALHLLAPAAKQPLALQEVLVGVIEREARVLDLRRETERGKKKHHKVSSAGREGKPACEEVVGGGGGGGGRGEDQWFGSQTCSDKQWRRVQRCLCFHRQASFGAPSYEGRLYTLWVTATNKGWAHSAPNRYCPGKWMAL